MNFLVDLNIVYNDSSKLESLANMLDDYVNESEPFGMFSVIDTKTGKEADTYTIALKEDWAKGLCYCDIEGWAIGEDGALMLVDECGRFAYADRERFKVVFSRGT